MANERDLQGSFEQLGETLGGMAGRAAGQATDMAMNVAGSVLTSIFQGMGAWWSSADAQQAFRNFGGEQDRASRAHFEQSAPSSETTAADYERVRPRYHFGHVAGQNPDYQGKSFDEVEAELQRAWETAAREGFGDWNEVREQVNHGYTYRTSGAPNPS